MAHDSHLYYPKVVDEAPAYIFGGLAPGHDLVFVPDFALQPRSFVRKVLKFLLVGRIPLGGRLTELITGYRGYHWLTTLHSGDRLLVNGVTNLHTLRAIAWLTPKGVRRFQYFNNCLRFFIPPEEVAHRVEKMKEMGYHLVSFDPQESADYGMTYAPQFYRFPEPYSEELRYDFFFCGVRKDRGERLDQLKAALQAQGFTCKFVVVGEGGQRRIDYEEYLHYVRQSRCLVDLFQEGQVGLTRRPLEALFFNKKLLTENAHIAQFDFYHPQNIFILGKDDMAQVSTFMSTPSVDVPTEVKRRYDVNTWLNYFS